MGNPGIVNSNSGIFLFGDRLRAKADTSKWLFTKEQIMRRALLASVFPFLLFSGAPLEAQSEVLSLDTIVVTADRTAESIRGVSQNMDVITTEELQRSPAYGVMDVLKKYGIQINNNGSAGAGQESITIRGFSSGYHGNDINSSVLILIDGRRAVGDSLSMQSLNNIERIEIIRGPGSMQYGSSAMGGVVNIITKRGGENPNVRLEAGFGTFDYDKQSLFASGQIGKFDLAASGSRSSIDDYKDGEGVKHDNSGYDYRVNSMANIGYNFNDYNRLGLSLQASRNNDGGPEADPFRYIDKDLKLYDLLYEGGTEDGDKTWMARFFGGKSSYSIDYTLAASGQRFKQSKSENDFYGAQGQFSWAFDRVAFTAGADWTSYDFTQTQMNSSNTYMQSFNDSTFENVGVFLIGKAYFLEDKNLVLTAGLRYDEFELDVDNKTYRNRNDWINGVDSLRGQGKVDRRFDDFLPSVGLAYSLTDYLKLRAHWGEAFKAPTPRQLAGGFYMGTTLYLGDTALEPEKSSTWEVGFDYARDGLGFSATYFDTNFENYIGTKRNVTINGVTGTQYVNMEDVTISGLELKLDYQLGQKFGWDLDLTPYLNLTHLFEFEDNTGMKINGIARNSMGFGVGLAYEPFGLNVSIDGTYYGGRSAGETTPVGKNWQGGATIWDLSLVKSLYNFDDANSLKLKVAANNIFDKAYNTSSTTGEVLAPGSSVYMGLIYEMK